MLFPFLLPTLFTSGEPELSAYDEINVRGDLTIDEMQWYWGDIDDSVLFAHGTTEPAWDVNTILLMPFNNTLDAGNFATNDDPVTSWRILRRRVGDTEFTFIEEVDNTSVNVYFDVRAESGIEYEYGIQSVSNGTRGEVIISEAISVAFWGWILQSLDYNPDTSTGVSFLLDTELSTSGSEKNISITQYDNTFALRPKVEYGNMQYFSETLNFIPRECDENDNVIVGSHVSKEAFDAFLGNKEAKILKNGSGDTYVVVALPYSFKYLDKLTNSNGYEQPFSVTAPFIQIADPADVL